MLEGVSVTYPGGTTALDGTDLALRDREVTVLLGPSGAGKSTLLRTLNHLVPPTSGRVAVRGAGDLRRPADLRAHRRRTAMIFQQHQLIGRASALQNVLTARVPAFGFWRSLLPLPPQERRWALECLDAVGLLDKALSRCDALSGGQQQRVGIARAMAQRPSLVLADEPVASLDPASAARVLRSLRDVTQGAGIPVVVSLHQLDYARRFADRVVGLAGGRIVFDGPPAALGEAALERIYGTRPQEDPR